MTVTRFKKGMDGLHKDAIGADASGVISRSDFNMSHAVPIVGDQVTVTIALEANVP
jgi:polyisoprenoid-binding protein YceI